ncbi:hypothetical protein NDU88_007567 [Pleurodeles waltl]|uniref:Uncharacterized protein n=1 Tax=Pleurodeles waltl TaxID=8319 RepID=A0AAV7WHG6_PLEWA|nr:hypothetical protein NDU88_007567 [Pleurodeles waltl]
MSLFLCQQVHQRSVHRRIPPSSHMSQLTLPKKDNSEEPVTIPPGQCPPEEGHLACHRQGGPDPGGPPETGHSPLQQEDGGAQLRMASQRGRGARRTMTPLMFRILAVAYPELDGCLRTSQQTQRASTGGGTVAPEHEGAASHMAMEGHTTDSEYTSGTEGEGSFTSATGSPTSDTDSSADSRRSASAKKPPVPVVRVPGFWSAPSTRAGSRTRSQGTGSPPPVKAPKLESGRRDRVKTPGGTTSEMGSKAIGESAVTPKKVGKVPRKSAQPVVSVTVEKCAIISGGPDTTAVTGPEPTARDSAQEGPSIVTGPETTAQDTAQEGPSIVTGPETTAQDTAQEGPSIITGPESTAQDTAQVGPGCHSPAGQ